jgi:TIR domain
MATSLAAGKNDGRVKVFLSYAHKDQSLRNELDEHLGALKGERLIEVWWDNQILPGSEWNREIASRLEEADLILLLVSSAFLNSTYCYENEMRRAVERHEASAARVIWIYLRPCHWKPAPFAKLQGLPEGMKPVTSWTTRAKRDAVWAEIAAGIHRVVEECAAGRAIAAPAPDTAAPQSKAPSSSQLPSSEALELRREVVLLAFVNQVDLKPEPITSLLQAYYHDLWIKKVLTNYEFDSDQIAIGDDSLYNGMRQRVEQLGAIDVRRQIFRLEIWLIDGIRIILNHCFIKEKQVLYTYASCYWFAKLVRSWIMDIMKSALGERGRVAYEDMSISHWEELAGEKFSKYDIWKPEGNPTEVTHCYLPDSGYAGSWFKDHPQIPGSYTDHYSPNDHYNFVIPQLILRHFLNGEDIIQDFTGYKIGLA